MRPHSRNTVDPDSLGRPLNSQRLDHMDDGSLYHGVSSHQIQCARTSQGLLTREVVRRLRLRNVDHNAGHGADHDN